MLFSSVLICSRLISLCEHHQLILPTFCCKSYLCQESFNFFSYSKPSLSCWASSELKNGSPSSIKYLKELFFNFSTTSYAEYGTHSLFQFTTNSYCILKIFWLGSHWVQKVGVYIELITNSIPPQQNCDNTISVYYKTQYISGQSYYNSVFYT